MRVLFCARHFGYLRNFESVIRLLAECGHEIHLAADREESTGGKGMVARLAARYPNVSYGWTPAREDDVWLAFATRVRLAQDYLRYLDRRYDHAPKLRQRAKERTPALVQWLVERLGFRYRPGRALLRAALRAIERAVPLDPSLDAFFRSQRPDVVLLTPLIDLGSPQLDLLKTAKAQALRTVLCVGSWDHLSSKALIWILPDLITVWNEVQKREALELHGVPPDRVAVTGAQCYDQWFDRRPSRTREEFCRGVGLPPERPFILYVCSSLFRGGPTEAQFVEQWMRAIRASSDPALQRAGILARPHPSRMDEWETVDVRRLPDVALHGGNPIDDESKADYFDALSYSAAVIGLNTSAFLEAGIAGRPVHTILHEDYWKSQTGTLHFHYLLEVGGGLLRAATTLEEHLRQLAEALTDPDSTARNRPFVEAFLRPHGIDRQATPLFVDEIERLGARGPAAAERPPAWAPLLRRLLAPFVRAGRWRGRKRQLQKLQKDFRHAVRKSWQRAQKAGRQGLRRFVERPLTDARQLVVPRTERARALTGTEFDALEEVQIAREAIIAVGRSRGPIIVGPWLSEAGFELLYWIPFLTWAKTYGNLREDRLVVVSRGGAARWYRHVASTYRDIFDYYAPDEFRERNAARIAEQDGQKHFAVTALDDDILDRVASSLGLRQPALLHPSLMYRLFRLFWLQQASLELVRAFTVPRLLRPAALDAPLAGLPSRYVAVKFYGNDALPASPENVRFMSSLVGALAERHEVVLLNTGMRFDEHDELAAGDPSRIHSAALLMSPRANLDVQTRIIARADALVATYGGFSYLGPLCGVKTLTFYSDAAGFRFDHLELAKRVFAELGGGAFVPLKLHDLDVLDIALGRIQMAPSLP